MLFLLKNIQLLTVQKTKNELWLVIVIHLPVCVHKKMFENKQLFNNYYRNAGRNCMKEPSIIVLDNGGLQIK